ncbi:sigma-70 family RNA polymerase sigma factor [Phycisphaeraceae bacterium D3-23]
MPQSDATWSDWYDEHMRALVLLARQWCPTHADAEDAVHDAFTTFWPKRTAVDDPAAYLYRCTRNAAIDQLRSKKRRKQREQRAATDKAALLPAIPTPAFEDHEDRLALEQALETLPKAQREAVVMKVWGGLTFEQIGSASDVSPNTAASRYRYGLAALRKAMETEAQDG